MDSLVVPRFYNLHEISNPYDVQHAKSISLNYIPMKLKILAILTRINLNDFTV